MSSKPSLHGAKWWKFEFHTHTPKSNDYGRGADQATLKQKTSREWLLDYMQAGIDCVAITDHNSGQWIDPLKAELAAIAEQQPSGYRPLTLFPGVEISVNGGVHVLALFEPETGSDKILRLLSKCEFEGAEGETEDCTRKSCSEVIEIIAEEGGIPILAHVDGPAGVFQIQRGVTLRQTLKSEGLLAMEVVGPTYVLPGTYSELRLNLASIVGSDAHHPSDVGTRFTWVKMQSPNLNALRLALHDCEDGVKRCEVGGIPPNEIGHRFHLRRMIVSNAQKAGNGQSLEIQFSPWMTTVIGGRGSGKSSVLDFMRIALGRSEGMPPEVEKEFEKFNRVPPARGDLGMLRTNTGIRLEFAKDGREIALTWRSAAWTQEELNENGEWLAAGNPGDVPRRFPVRIFSQKQLYEMTKQPNVLLNLIDDRWDKPAWFNKRDTLLSEWLRMRRETRQAVKQIANIAQTRAELDDVKAKIRIFEDSGYKEILSQYDSVQTTKQSLDSKTQTISNASSGFEEFCKELPTIQIEQAIADDIGKESTELLDTVLADFGGLVSKLRQIEKELKALTERWSKALDSIPWKSEFDSACEKYEKLKTELKAAGGTDISAYSTLVEKRRGLQENVNKLSEYEAALSALRSEEETLKGDLDTHEKLLRTERQRIISSWVQPGGGEQVRITLQEMGDLVSAQTGLRQLIRKPGDEFTNDIYRSYDDGRSEGLLSDLIEKTEPQNRWQKLAEMRSILLDASGTDSKGLDRRFGRHLEQLRANTPEDLDRLAVWVPEDKIKLELVQPNGTAEDIEIGSAGQRTAGLLGLILSLDDSPLIIDQPEDDLESRLISSLVVTGLRFLKQRQQLIVVTHNPNIPVNGAAEQIVEMRFYSGQIRIGSMGALQNAEIRRAVCEVMEGGKEALDKRYFRISRALN
jgi:DNA repair ATPase RecN/histidinol phosphatase-like PHP family hydrolase